MSLATPEKIRSLQRKLYRKAEAEPVFRFYVLYDKICREDILRHAYGLARTNAGAPGVDGVSFAQIEETGLEAWLASLREELVSKTYRPDPVRRVRIPKLDGGERPLGIPTIRDRVVQTAAKLVLEPIFEADFEDNTYGYRRGRAAEALTWTKAVMTKLGLTLNEVKTSLKNARQDRFDFLGYSFGPHHYKANGKWYLGASPSKKSVQRLKTKVGNLLVSGNNDPWCEVRDTLNRSLRGWSNYFSYGTRRSAFRGVDRYVYERVRDFLARRHKVAGRGTRRFSCEVVYGERGLLRLERLPLTARLSASR